MGHEETREHSVSHDHVKQRVPVITASQGDVEAPPNQGRSCPTCAGAAAPMTMSYVYTLGRIEPRFPSLAVEKEFAQATGRAGTAGLSDRQALHAVLSQRP